MLGEGQDRDGPSGDGAGAGVCLNRKTYLRSASWTDRSPRTTKTPIPRPQLNTKARLCLPTLQPLSISRRNFEEWPGAGSDDLGIWPQAPTPGAKGSTKHVPNSEPEREFQFKKDKLAFFDKECSGIVDHVYLGSDAVAKNREILRKNRITHVLNCVGFACPEYFKDELVYKTLWLQDSPSEDITSILYDVFDYFEDVRVQGGRVLVHCCQGVSRSTSLVIAYLMWREKQSFEDAFQYVKAARGVTNPNMGFACQLLLCQKRIVAFLASPTSVLRMYRMAPHSPYDPLHLVPKMISQPGPEALDSRGAFVIHVPTAVYVWIGKHCASIMSENANKAASQVIHYEMALGPTVTTEEERVSDGNNKPPMCLGLYERKVDLYDLDFEIFHRALAGGVVPPLPLSGTSSETCLPARENGWGILRRKLASGIMKEFIRSSKSSHGGDVDNSVSQAIPPLPPNSKSGSADFLSSTPTSSPNRLKDNCKDVEESCTLTNPLLSPTPSCSSLDSLCSYLVHSPKVSSKSPLLSPSTSDYSSSFTFSPSSSNWSDLSYLSSQTSPSRSEPLDPCLANTNFLDENACLLCKRTAFLKEKTCSVNQAPREANICPPCRGTTPFIAEQRGSNPPLHMTLPSADEASEVPQQLVRSWSFSLPDLEDAVMRDVEYDQSDQEAFYELNREEAVADADMLDASNELQRDTENGIDSDTFHLPSSHIGGRVTEAEVTSTVLYRWPTLDKVEMPWFNSLDSTSVCISFLSGGVYVWLGREVSSAEGQNQIQWEIIGRKFLKQMALPLNSAIQVVREGEEPEEFLRHLNLFSFPKT
ncbi:Protein-tyrosine-phosphatase [Bertholletia excelsa]